MPEQRRQKANDAVRRQQIHDEVARRAVDVGETEVDENGSILDNLMRADRGIGKKGEERRRRNKT